MVKNVFILISSLAVVVLFTCGNQSTESQVTTINVAVDWGAGGAPAAGIIDSIKISASSSSSTWSATYPYSAHKGSITGIPPNSSVTVTVDGINNAGTAIFHGVYVANDVTNGMDLDVAVTPTIPIISVQPQSQAVAVGNPVTFTVSASGNPVLAFQWQKNDTDISGATSDSLKITTTQVTDSGTYSVIVSNSQGNDTSSGAKLTVNPVLTKPLISVQPSPQTVTVGGMVTFRVTATGNPSQSYVWRKNGTTITGATGSSYQIASTLMTDSGTYSVIVSNSQGSDTSSGAKLTVNALVIANGLIAYYPFSGNANDMSGNGHNGTVVGATLTTDRFGNINSAYSFNGINNYIYTDTMHFANQVSFSCWLKPISSDTDQMFIVTSTKAPYLPELNTVTFELGKTTTYYAHGYYQTPNDNWAGVVAGTAVVNNKWIHIVYIYDYSKSTAQLYENDSLVDVTTATIPVKSFAELWIGSHPNPTDFFYGSIDDVRIYNYDLTPAEIDSLYHEGGWVGNASSNTVTDFDGNVYNTITIGTQVWMAENLKTTHYNDGTVIPLVTDNGSWVSLSTPGYCWYNDSVAYGNPYGALYNWYAVNTGKLAPSGWHVPSDSEWEVLGSYLGGDNIAGGSLKDTGTTYWTLPNIGATNSSGFTALPGGYRYSTGGWDRIGNYAYWWTSTAIDAGSCWRRYIYGDSVSVNRGGGERYYGFSIRCIKN